LSAYEQDSVIEFLKTLQVLPPGTEHLTVDDRGRAKSGLRNMQVTAVRIVP
jgi:hypothetical protein